MAHLTESKTIALLSVVFVLPLLVLACRDFDDRAGSSGLTPTTELSAAGVWEGDYNTLIGVGDSGEVTFVIEQDSDGTLSGCSCWTKANCWDDGLFSGSVKGNKVQAATVLDVLRDPVGATPRRGRTRVIGKIDIIGDSMSGSFEVTRDDARRCSDNVARTGDQGTLLDMRRVASDVDVAGICDKGLHNVSDDAVESCVWIEDLE
jgi:hypothetical protein